MQIESEQTPSTMRFSDEKTQIATIAAADECTLGLEMAPASVPRQDLSGDKLVHSAPRIRYQEHVCPSLGGIPLLAKLGQGGMGAVYLGIHPRLNKRVAVKVLPFDLAERSPDIVSRFQREAQLAARIQSPHLVGVFDVNQENGLFYLVMEYVEGASGQRLLEQVKQTGASGLDESIALDICIASCAGLAAAHATGIIHRDVKPDNILVPIAGTELNFPAAKLADLGLARSEKLAQKTVTKAGACMGTPGYMSPEQVGNAKSCGKQADVFSFGATLYSFLSGAAPFKGNALLDVLRSTVDSPHVPIRQLCPTVSEPTSLLIDCCLFKDPTQRYVDATALLSALKVCRSALVEPHGAVQAASRLSELLHATEVGEAVRPSNRPLTPIHATHVATIPLLKKYMRMAILIFFIAIVGTGVAFWLINNNRIATQKNENRLALTTAINAATQARQKKDWKAVLETVETLSALPANNDHPSIGIANNLVVEAKAELKKEEEEFNAIFKNAITKKLILSNDVPIELVCVPAGVFKMGADEKDGNANLNEKPSHTVQISHAFWMGRFPVTVQQFNLFINETKYVTDAEVAGSSFTLIDGKWDKSKGANWRNPGFVQLDNHPVVLVSHNDALAFAQWLSDKVKSKVRLPTEAEWEYAARSPNSYFYPWGNSWLANKTNHADQSLKNCRKDLSSYSFSNENDGSAFTSRVGCYENASWCGALDMAGNVSQMCEDWYGRFYYVNSERTDPKGPKEGDLPLNVTLNDEDDGKPLFVMKGSSWIDVPQNCLSSKRSGASAKSRRVDAGFRIVIECTNENEIRKMNDLIRESYMREEKLRLSAKLQAEQASHNLNSKNRNNLEPGIEDSAPK